MNVFSTYLQGWGLALKHLKLWSLLYLLNLLFAVLLSFPIFSFFNKKLSHSMAMDKLIERFDFTVYTDIMNEYGDIVGWLSSQGIITSFLFLLLSVFLVGGILNVWRHRDVPFRMAGFWTGCSKFFWRIFGLTLLFLLLHGLLVFIFISLFSYLTAGGLDRFGSEVEIYQRGLLLFPFYAFFATLFWMVQDYTKVAMVDKDLSIFRSLGQGIRFVIRHFFPTFFLYFLNLLIFGLVFYLYWRTPTSNAALLAIIIGQLFLFFRIGTKLVNLGTAMLWYDSKRSS